MSRSIDDLISAIILLPVSISFILSPLNYDLHIFQGVARLTDYFGPFPQNIDLAWEIKPIGNRMINYLLCKAGTILAPFGTAEYEMVLKLIGLLMVLAVCYYFSSKVKNRFAFLIASLAFLTTVGSVHLQAEWFAVMLALLAIAWLSTERPVNHYLAGAAITGIFLLKGVTLLLVIPILIAVWMLDRDMLWRTIRAGEASVISLVAVVASGLFPNMIPDMILSSQLAHVGLWGPGMMLALLITGFLSSLTPIYIPAILVGLALLPVVCWLERSGRIRVLALLVSWAAGFLIVFIQSECFFPYQYFVLAIPAITTLMLLKEEGTIAAVTGMLVLFVLMNSVWSPGMAEDIRFNNLQRDTIREIREKFPDMAGQKEILYLDVGNAPYYFEANSSCRHICPLPVQRNSRFWNISTLPAYRENMACIAGYQGKYIVAATNESEFWKAQEQGDAARMWGGIDRNYTRVWGSNWAIFEKTSAIN